MKISYALYKENAYKGTPQVYFDYWYRKLSHPVTYALLRLGAKPNHISIASIGLAVLGGLLLLGGRPVLGMVFFVISYLLDFCDGNAARVYIKTVGLSEIDQKKGGLIENVNTNISYFMLYFGLGTFLGLATVNVFYVLVAFMAYSVKMISRYLLLQSYPVFAQFFQSTEPGETTMNRYTNSWKVQVKFFFSKCLFSANFYYAIYLAAFVLTPLVVPTVFILYAAGDMAVSIYRGLRVFFRKIPQA